MRQQAYPTIEPLSEAEPRPLWSVMIPTYNRTKYLEGTLRSVLEQVDASGRAFGPGEMQIEVVDNASPTSEIADLVRRVGGERVQLFRQEENVGLCGNWNTCIERARGRWVHILHDDDLLLPGFYARYGEFVEAHPEVGLVLSRPILMDEGGEWKNIMATPPSLQETKVWEDGLMGLVKEDTSHFLRCPTIVVARRAYEKVGGFDPSIRYTLDLQMWIRVAAAFPVGYVHRPLTLYREHSHNATNALLTKMDLIADIRGTLGQGIAMLPPEKRAEARIGADLMAAHTAGNYSRHLHSIGQHRAALRYTRHLFRLSPGRFTARLLLRSFVRALGQQVSGSLRHARP